MQVLHSHSPRTTRQDITRSPLPVPLVAAHPQTQNKAYQLHKGGRQHPPLLHRLLVQQQQEEVRRSREMKRPPPIMPHLHPASRSIHAIARPRLR
jgi:hypothetical protein